MASSGQVSIEEEGTVLYKVEDFPSGKMMEARILFPPSLVPDSSKIISENRFDKIMAEELSWAKSAERQHNAIFLAIALIPLIIIINIVMAVRFYFKYDRELKPEIKLDYYRELPEDITPAVLSQLINLQGATTKEIMATLMDLARKGFLKIEEEGTGRKKDFRFVLISRDFKALERHELNLINWLFSVIGNGKDVSLKEIENYSKKTAKSSWSQQSFFQQFTSWQKIVREEFRKYEYFNEDKPGLKAALKTVSLEFSVIFVLIVSAVIFKMPMFFTFAGSYRIYRRSINHLRCSY